jgi:DNA polymerase-1
LERASEIKQKKRRENLIEFAGQARISKELVTLYSQCEGLPPLDELTSRPVEQEMMVEFLQQMEFTSLISRIKRTVAPARMNGEGNVQSHKESSVQGSLFGEPTTPAVPATPQETRYSLVQNQADLAQWCEAAKRCGSVAFDLETPTLGAMTQPLVGVSFSVKPGEACYIPFGHTEGDQLSFDKVKDVMKDLLEDSSILKIGHNIKYDMLVMKCLGIEVSPIEDTMLLSYALDAGKHGHGMDELCEKHLGIKPVSFSDVCGTGRNKCLFNEVPLDRACEYAAEDADLTLRLHQFLKARLIKEKLVTLYERIDRPLVPIVVEMEHYGVKIDISVLRTLSHEFAAEMKGLEQQIHALAGHEFNIGSPKQLGEVLFDELGLPGGKKSKKTGAYSTTAQILEDLAAVGHELPGKVVEWRQLSKLKSTYCDSLVEQINERTGRVHTSFSLAATSTGRLSSTDPNLQNIPIRTEQGRKLRNAFVAADDYQLMSADYSQIELRLLAEMAGIKPLQKAFREGRDIHATTASQMFGVPVEEVSGELRRKAKTINFGIIYGISAHGLSVRLGIPREEAAEYIATYFRQYPGIRHYMDQQKEIARSKGYVTTLFGRRCHIPGIRDKNGNVRAFAERQAINAPLQGTAADIIKRAMIHVADFLKHKQTQSRMLLQVHDELIFELHNEEKKDLPPRIIKIMEGAAEPRLSLVVEHGIGQHWGEIH